MSKPAKSNRKMERRPVDFTNSGRIISMTKTAPEGHICVFNANVCIKSSGKIWFGDLDLTNDADDLKRLAAERGEDVFVLREHDCRFMTASCPRYENTKAIITPSGEISFPNT